MDNNDTERIYRGSCNCRGVLYEVKGPLREIVACHCGQCRKQSGLYFAATEVIDSALTLQSSTTLKWYASSSFAKRGFCGECGSSLFWKMDGSHKICVLPGSFDDDVPIKIARHIFCQDKGSYYDLNDGLPQFPQDDVPYESYFQS